MKQPVDTMSRDLTAAHEKLQSAKRNWQLSDDGDTFNIHSSLLQPVLYKGIKAMLKIPIAEEERRSASLMVCWNGNGAAKVLKHSNGILLMERAEGTRSLKQMVMDGHEDEANSIICNVMARLHSAKCAGGCQLIPLSVWFAALEPAASRYGGVLLSCQQIAGGLLKTGGEAIVLHGDVHYDNVLCSGNGGWVAIDPKGLLGERAFDFANLFCNPDIKHATSSGRLSRQARRIATEAGLDVQRLLQWIAAWAGLSASWTLNDGEDAKLPLKVAEIALKELNAC